jgi:hypothetical protein
VFFVDLDAPSGGLQNCFEIPKATNHAQDSYNDPPLSV